MKPINKPALIRSLVITAITSWFTWLCIWPSSCNKMPTVGDDQQTSFLFKAEHAQLAANYRNQLTAFKITNDSLQRELLVTKQKLKVSQGDALKNKLLVKQRIAKDASDTLEKLADCDSLKQEVTDYVASVEVQDSLQEKAITELEAIVSNKDSALVSCDNGFQAMANLANSSIQQQQKVEQALQKANKTIKRKTAVTYILTGTTVVLVGITTLFIIR